MSAILFPWPHVKYERLPCRASNSTLASHIVYTAAVICAPASMNYSGFSFTACSKIDTPLGHIYLLWCANISIQLSNILLQSGSRPSHSRKQLTYSSFSVSSLSERLLPLQGTAGRLGFRVPFSLESVGLSGVIPATFLVGAGSVVPTSYSVGTGGVVPMSFLMVPGRVVLASVTVDAGWIIKASFTGGAGGTIQASLSEGLLVPSSDPSSARSIKCSPTLLSSFACAFPLFGGVGGRSILLLSGDGGGMGISWLAGSTDGEMVRSPLAWLQSSMPWL